MCQRSQGSKIVVKQAVPQSMLVRLQVARLLVRYARLQAVVVSFHKVGEGVQRQSEHSLYTSVVGLEERAGRRRVESRMNKVEQLIGEPSCVAALTKDDRISLES